MENRGKEAERLQFLFERFYKNEASKEEMEDLSSLLRDEDHKARLPELLKNAWQNHEEEQLFSREQSDAIYASIFNARKEAAGKGKSYRVTSNFRRFAAAAAITGILVFVSLMVFRNNNNTDKKNTGKETIAVKKSLPTDVAPGKEGAVLTLEDGKQIALDSTGNGLLASQGNIQVTKTSGQISYQGQDKEATYNTMTTPRGRQFSLVLADGSKVWLNAASAVRFPTAFISNERKVEIKGEAYLEIAHDPAKPFHVMINGLDITVIGTRFNVNAYQDESAIKTTLVEGKIMMDNGSDKVILQPGQQAQLNGSNKFRVINDIDVEDVIAWKNGLFTLDGTDAEILMKQIARWYDIEIIQEGPLPKKRFVGSISRNINLSDLVKALNELGIQCRLENRKLIVQP